MTPSIAGPEKAGPAPEPKKPDAPPVPAPKNVNPVARFFSIENPYLVPLLITSILIAGHFTFGFLEAVPKTLTAIVVAMLTEAVLGFVVLRKPPQFATLASAYVTGISAGILIRSPEYWPYALAAAIAISSKYVIRVGNRHLWNPSNLAIVILVLVAHDTVATLSVQWGNDILPLIVVWLLGSLIISRLKRFHICATYAVSFLFFAWVRTFFTHDTFWAEASPITGPMYQLFIFFMITDPKTTTKNPKTQMLVAFLIAFAECILRLMPNFIGSQQAAIIAAHAPYFALTIMGPASNLLEIHQQNKAKKEAELKEKAAAPPLPPV